MHYVSARVESVMGRMRSASVLVAVLLLTIASLLRVSPAVATGTAGTTIFVEPDQLTVLRNHTYVVNVRLNDVVDLAGWQFELYWNRAMLSCINATVNTPAVWGGVGFDWFNKTAADVNVDSVYIAGQFGPGIDNDYSAALGQYFKAECSGPNGGPYHNTFNGSMSLVTLTFKATDSGTTALTLENTKLGNSAALPIEHTAVSGSKVLLVPGETEPPQTTSKLKVKNENQVGLKSNATAVPNWKVTFNVTATSDGNMLTAITVTEPLEVFPANCTVTLPIVVFPVNATALP